MNQSVDEFLDQATDGLRDDPELRLDVRAELAAHIEDKIRELRMQGVAEKEAVGKALKATGAPGELAAGLAEANRERMTRRARIRALLRFLVVPAAVLAALWCVDVRMVLATFSSFANLTGAQLPRFLESVVSEYPPFVSQGRRLTAKERLILFGDERRSGAPAQQRAIWEAWPDNRIFLQNYVTYLAAESNTADERKFEHYVSELRMAMAKDPGNARYHYLLADALLRRAAKIVTASVEKTPDGRTRVRSRLEIKDRRLLDDAMAEFRRGLEKPLLRRGGAEMLRERLNILHPPIRRYDQIRMVALAASVLLPDLQVLRRLIKAAGLYGGLLASEGRFDQAEPFLNAWEKLAVQLNDDAWTLIDELVLLSIVDDGAAKAAEVCEAAGKHARAEEIRRRAQMLGAAVREWRQSLRRNDKNKERLEQIVRRSAGMLTGQLLPALGSTTLPAPEELEPDRLMDYVLAEEMYAAAVSILLLACTLGAGGIGLWRRIIDRSSPALLLLPDARAMGRVVLLGVISPALIWWLLTECTFLGRRDWNLSSNRFFFIGQAALLASIVLFLVVSLSFRWIRERCGSLGLTRPPAWPPRRLRQAATGAIVILAIASLNPMRSQAVIRITHFIIPAVLVVLGVLFAVWGIGALARGAFASRRYAFYAATAARSFVPFAACALIVWSALTRPWLLQRERMLVRRDAILSIPTDGPIGFTSIEARLVQRLKRETTEAVRRLGYDASRLKQDQRSPGGTARGG